MKSLIAYAALCLTASFTSAAEPDARASRRLEWSYPAFSSGCVLGQELTGRHDVRIPILYNIGSSVRTKHGRWKCVSAIVSQEGGARGGVWIEAKY
ncbi:hypothetical protein [Variovorax gossypii]